MRWESWLARLALAGLAIFQFSQGNQSGGLVAVEGFVVSLLPRLIAWLSKVHIPRVIELLFVLGMVLQFISESTKLFEVFTYWDKIVHPTEVALTAWLAVWFLLGYRDAFAKRMPLHLVGAIGLLLGITVGCFWEFVEFASDWFGDANLQKSNADTMTDIIANDIGAFVSLLLALRLYGSWLGSSDRQHTGELAHWLAHAPSRLLSRHGRVVGALLAVAMAGVLVGANRIDQGTASLTANAVAGSSVTWNGLAQPFEVLAGDWQDDPSRGTCRINLEHLKPGSEKAGLLQIGSATSAYGIDGQPFSIESQVFEQRPPREEGTQMDAGLAFGIRDASDFYLLEQSALHDVFRLDRYVHGRRRDVREELVRTHGDEWHGLRVLVAGSRVSASIDGQEIFVVPDVADTSGGVGLWARISAAGCFRDTRVTVG